MADIDIASSIKKLRQHLPHVPPISVRKLKALHGTRDYEGMVRLIRSAMNLEVRLLVGWISSGESKEMTHVPAWVEMPVNMPYYGTAEFKKLSIKVFIRKDFLENRYDKVAIAIAHELSHIVLDSIHHPLRREEKAVDLTAMLLGFSRLYMIAAHTAQSKLGYLTLSELKVASRILVPMRWRLARGLSIFVQSFARPLVAAGILLSIVASEKINSKIKLHQSLRSEVDNLVVPRALGNSYMTLVDAQVGLFSLTKTYQVQPGKLDLSDREQRVRDAVCARNRANIDAGAVYAYEYREPSGRLIGRFEVSSCP
jgi:hypothetical protein